MVDQSASTEPSIKQTAHELHQHFGVFNVRCAFVLEALANFSFDEKVETLSPSALGAMSYVGEMLEDLTQLQEMFDKLHEQMKDK